MTTLFHGPSRLPVALPLEPASPAPYLGIVPRGLLPLVGDLERRTGIVWSDVAPVLDAALREGVCTERLVPWLDAALAVGALAWSDAATVCLDLGTRLDRDPLLRGAAGLPPGTGCRDAEFWHVKEGHTSTVWHVTMHPDDGTPPLQRCVNISRDAPSAVELRAAAAYLTGLAAVDPAHAVAAEPLPEVSVRGLHATVTIAPWVPASELHVMRSTADSAAHLVEVGWFLPPNGAGAQRIFGRRVPSAEAACIRRQFLEFLERHTRATGSEMELPRVAFNEGDAVWTGDRLVIVSVADQPLVLDDDCWHTLRTSNDGWLPLAGVAPLPSPTLRHATA